MEKWQSRSQPIEVDPQRIRFNKLNPRKHSGHEYARLKASVKQFGIIQPPTVRVLPGGFYEVVDGEGRVSIAQEEHFEKILVISVGIIDERYALEMLQSANSVRNYHFVAECRGYASLHRQGHTNEQLAEQFGVNVSRLQYMVAIGYYPDEIFAKIQDDIARSEIRAARWGFSMLANILPLREFLPGHVPPAAKWFSYDGIYNYDEVRLAVEKVITEEITSAENMEAYVVKRRFEIFQERFDQELQRKLEHELAETKDELEVIKDRQVHEIEQRTQSQYQSQIDVLQHQLDELSKRHTKLVTEVAKRPEIVEQREKELGEALRKAETERRQLQQLRAAWEEEARLAHAKQEQELRIQREQKVREIKEQLGVEFARQQEEQQQRLKQMEGDLKSFYERKDQERQYKAENTIRGLLSHGIKSLAETQQIIEHIISAGMLQGVQQLGGPQQESLLWAIRSLHETLNRAEEKLSFGDAVLQDVILQVESGGANGHEAHSSEEPIRGRA